MGRSGGRARQLTSPGGRQYLAVTLLIEKAHDDIERLAGHADPMTSYADPWVRGRGLERLLAQETNVSDIIQFLSDRDPSPWGKLVGFVPDDVAREAQEANHADLLLTSDSRTAVVEVKLGHLMSAEQQGQYEALPSQPALYLAALSSDEVRLDADSHRWSFLSLSDLIGRWTAVDNELARLIASEAVDVLRIWDQMISGVFDLRTAGTWTPLSVLKQKFLARVATRRIARDLRMRGRVAWAGVTSGGGLPIVQGWTPVRDEGNDRAFIAEIRWSEEKPVGELRFGVDFDPRPGQGEDEEVRRAAYELARSMDAVIEYARLRDQLSEQRPDLADLLRGDRRSRPRAKGDWERVVVHGFQGAPLPGGKKNNRRRTSPDFFGDGALRFQAKAKIDFTQASACDVTDLIDWVLNYLVVHQP
jgi:hypothetical protein